MKSPIAITFFTILFIGFISCGQAPKQQDEQEKTTATQDTTDYLKKGKAIAGATFTALSGELQRAMKEGGVSKAVSYCNLAAMPLVDSLSKVHDAQIKRTSLKVRNPVDTPTPEERVVLEAYHKKAEAGEALQPMTKPLQSGAIAFYAPIKVNAFCLQCHGKPGETLKEEDYAYIKKHYPKDEAIGYADGELRGMWSITFNAN